MFYLNFFLQQLDKMYGENPAGLEEFMKKGLEEARSEGDEMSALVILNELMGYYRVKGSAEGVDNCARQCLDICHRLGLGGTEDYATVLLNIATGYRAFGRYDEAEQLYQQAGDIFDRMENQSDYRIASLHNNLSSLYLETGRASEAKEQLLMAMDIITGLDDAQAEIAITHTNLGSVCFQLGESSQGKEHMLKAVEIFEGMDGKKDVHYGAALSGLGQAFFLEGLLEEARETYGTALAEIEANYGKNPSYVVVKQNLELVEDTIARTEAAKSCKLRGMEICRRYYETYGRQMMEEKYPQYVDRIAVGLVGEGSECLGFDDEYSWDHDFGPGFCMWLRAEDFEDIGEALQADYDRLPGALEGVPARRTMEQGKGRVGVFNMDEFFGRYVGAGEEPQEGSDFWKHVSTQALGIVTGGEVFYDMLGEFTARRQGFMNFPEEERLRRVALLLGDMAQCGQYNYMRMVKRGDMIAASLCISRFMEAAMDCAYLLDKEYPPFYKWKARGLDNLGCLGELKGMLEELVRASDGQEKVDVIERICSAFALELRTRGLTSSEETFLEAHKDEILKNI